MRIEVPGDVLARVDVPMHLCARTGRAATASVEGRAQRHLAAPKDLPLLLHSPLLHALLGGGEQDGVPYRLPIARGTRRRRFLLQLASVLVGMAAFFVLVWAYFEPRPVPVLAASLSVAAEVALLRAYDLAWVRVRRHGDGVVLDRLDPYFAALLQAAVDEATVDEATAPAAAATTPPGWYADPAGGPALRWWDGAAWTVHVHGAAPAT
ncbi:MAG TPA: DUF2510 domain-containing protein [Frankiaceae bacterium]|nr:DUF2510 domain-containing protein [Frankiaceae bacterium]